jgi:alpha-D-ribose 1-methylphosphonate 5-triphosphate diphosphatase
MPADEMILTNARVVLADRVIDGTVVVRDGRIAAVDEGRSAAGEDMDGDTIIPGIVELHTDHLENHYAPRPKVRWNPLASVQAHDAQVAASGITTVFDALRVGFDEDAHLEPADMRRLADAIEEGVAGERLRVDHFIHLRCEVSALDALETFALYENDARVRLASLMDHTPGQRQFVSLDHHRIYYLGKYGMDEAAYQAMIDRRQAQAAEVSARHRRELADRCLERGIVILSHDDATVAHVAESIEHGVTVAEFPTTMEAAKAARAGGLSILMGAPNLVRGGSHTGNVAARTLMEAGLLDILSSDYVPFSLLHGVFMAAADGVVPLPAAIATITANPARAARLEDRGVIEPGRRADLVRVRVDHEVPMVRSVWREGRRVS